MSGLWATMRASRAYLQPRLMVERRCFHPSSSVLKKKSSKHASPVFEDDPFENADEEDELFSSVKKEVKSEAIQAKVSSSTQQDPAALFDSKYKFLTQQLLRPPPPQIRDNSLDFLLLFIRKETQLREFVDLLPKWRESGRKVHSKTALAFIDRCVKRNPSLLVEVFSNRRLYGVDIPNITEARRILHAIVNLEPVAENPDTLRNAAQLAALYPSYGLPPATQDFTSLALLAQACAQSPQQDISANALSALLPNLVAMLKEIPPPAMPDNISRIGKGDDPASVAERRHAGVSQTAIVEWKWAMSGLQVLRGALENLGFKGSYCSAIDDALQSKAQNLVS